MHASVRQACTISTEHPRLGRGIAATRLHGSIARRYAAAAVLLLLAPARALAPPRIYFDVASAGGSLGRTENGSRCPGAPAVADQWGDGTSNKFEAPIELAVSGLRQH